MTKIPGKLYSIIDDLCSTKKIFKESFESCIQQVEDRLTLKKVIQEKKETVEILQGQVLVLSFYYSLQKLNEFLILKDNGSKTTYAGYGFGELIGLVNYSLDKEFKKGEVLSLDDVLILMKNLNGNNSNSNNNNNNRMDVMNSLMMKLCFKESKYHHL
ncbi:hypothetical protein LY90DRAFT_506671 [Neocallimastix californiae]|uniref:Uncharacterized protein n=1 Tax=Neocallimastix californiae TaxID=1754190 RepID=A0A1Y2DBV2_9FUNG|nr:hypothetical protein LY90DRAFT_506671 [Neocallimastix californiae]|eukprot:ORY56753.1 hypothetical protein LY90DRAFT_506671 [Neocallimastix californiae]